MAAPPAAETPDRSTAGRRRCSAAQMEPGPDRGRARRGSPAPSQEQRRKRSPPDADGAEPGPAVSRPRTRSAPRRCWRRPAAEWEARECWSLTAAPHVRRRRRHRTATAAPKEKLGSVKGGAATCASSRNTSSSSHLPSLSSNTSSILSSRVDAARHEPNASIRVDDCASRRDHSERSQATGLSQTQSGAVSIQARSRAERSDARAASRQVGHDDVLTQMELRASSKKPIPLNRRSTRSSPPRSPARRSAGRDARGWRRRAWARRRR